MSDRKHASESAEQPSDGRHAAEGMTAEDIATIELRMQELEAERESITRERDELQDRLQRLTAEFQNFRRRSETQVEDQVRLRMESLLSSLIHVLDAMEAAFGATASSLGGDKAAMAVLEGFEQIRALLGSVLSSAGLQRMDVLGKPYDPRLHEVLFTADSAEHPPETVLAELRPGYLLKERVLRAAQVSVSKAPSA